MFPERGKMTKATKCLGKPIPHPRSNDVERLHGKSTSLRYKYGRKPPNTVSALMVFLQVNGQLRSFASIFQIEYHKSLIARSKDNLKLLHSYIRHKKQIRSSDGLGWNAVTDVPNEMADCFLDAFTSIYTTTIPVNPAPHQRCGAVLDDVAFSPADVYATLSVFWFGSQFSHGSGWVSSTVTKVVCCHSSHSSLQDLQTVPTGENITVGLGISLVVPIFKKGFTPRSEELPVSLTSVSSKSLERIISKELYAFLTDNQILTEEQFGFRPGRSTKDQLLLIYDEITASVDSGFPVDLIMFDFSKAFDVVCHAVLLDKLTLLGIQGC